MAVLQFRVRPTRTVRSQSTDKSQGHNPMADLRAVEPKVLLAQPERVGNGAGFKDDSQKHSSRSFIQRVIWKLTPSTTVGRAINAAAQRLHEVGIDTARLDAQVILAFSLGVDRSWLFAHYEYALNADEAERFTDLIARRQSFEPVAYLTGRKEFYGVDLMVDRRVLIPRPETEMLVDAVLDLVEATGEESLSIADIGTGSGAIAVAIAVNAPHSRLYAIDVSEDALQVARLNVEKNGLADRVTLLHGDLLAPLPGLVDVIVANLPYVDSTEYCSLDPDVRAFEPQLALEAGPDGLNAIARLLAEVPDRLRSGGEVLLEIGHRQGAAVLHLVAACLPQAHDIRLHRDYHDRDRMVTFSI